MGCGTNIRCFSRDIGTERAAELVARAGFTRLDYTPPGSADDRPPLRLYGRWEEAL